MPSGSVHFRVWAPKPRRVALVLEAMAGSPATMPREQAMTAEGNGYLSCLVPAAGAGTLYRFRLDGRDCLYPDPASRYQPRGPHGPSQVIDPSSFAWSDAEWKGVFGRKQVIYEMHIGTFTPEGSFRAAAAELQELAELGITVVELMPVAEFDGGFGWGYDGVALFAPYHLYGTADDLRFFVDRAHALGIAVILDVVYNHCGPSGCYLRQFSDDYFSTRYRCEWGEALNFDGANAAPVREFFIANAGYWIDEFHLDGLRLDATQQIFDASSDHVLAGVARRVREAAGRRATYIVAENEPQQVKLLRPPDQGGHGIDALWNDDFHHAARVALTGCTEAYFVDYRGTPQELISAVKRGYLYQGQWYRWQNKRRGTPGLAIEPSAFIHFIQNHDQVANTGLGKRMHALAAAGQWRAMTALLLLGPATPLLFQGQEFSASAPFLYFADHHPELAELVRRGRTEFIHQFPSLAAPDVQDALPLPHDPATFRRCKLDLGERERHREAYALHRDLLRLRRDDPVFSDPRRGGIDGAVLSEAAFALRFFSRSGQDDRLLIVNLGRDLALSPLPEPLLAPHEDRDWGLLWSSEHPRYGGSGTAPVRTDGDWRMPAMAALVLEPASAESGPATPSDGDHDHAR